MTPAMHHPHLPKDPVILLSFVNTQLRDHYETLDRLCHHFRVHPEEILKKLAMIDYHYVPELNQFR